MGRLFVRLKALMIAWPILGRALTRGPFVVSMQPGDVLVLHVSRPIGSTHAARIIEQFNKMLPGVTVLVLEELTVAGIIRRLPGEHA